MKKFLITIILIICFLFINQKIAVAADTCNLGEITSFAATVDGNQVTFNVVSLINKGETLYIQIDPNSILGSYYSVPITINSQGSGSVTTTVEKKNDWQAYIYDQSDVRSAGATICSTPITFSVTTGATPITPSPGVAGCKKLGDGCSPGVTYLCDTTNTKCATIDGSNYLVYRINDSLAFKSPSDAADINWDPSANVETAIGLINTSSPSAFIAQLLKILIGIGGGIAFLLMVFGSLKIILSAGNPESVKAGQEMITSAIEGLLFVIFSIFILQFIGVQLFALPGFGT